MHSDNVGIVRPAHRRPHEFRARWQTHSAFIARAASIAGGIPIRSVVNVAPAPATMLAGRFGTENRSTWRRKLAASGAAAIAEPNGSKAVGDSARA